MRPNFVETPLNFLRIGNSREGGSCRVHRSIGHVVAEDFSAVEVNDRAVISEDAKLQIGKSIDVGLPVSKVV